MLSAANGAIHLQIGAAREPTSASAIINPQIMHLFVTLAGVDAHPSSLARDDDPEWQPLATLLQAHPLQIDLLADPHAGGSSALFPQAVLPAGVYRQIRLRLENKLPGESFLEGNRCSAGALHCAVMSDGRIQPVSFSSVRGTSPDFVGVLPGHDLYIPPDGAVTLTIEFDADHSWLWFSGDFLFLTPVFHLSVQQQLASLPGN